MSFSLSRPWGAVRVRVFGGLVWGGGGGSAQAAVNCTARMDSVAFGIVELVDGSTPPSVNATLTYTVVTTTSGLVADATA